MKELNFTSNDLCDVSVTAEDGELTIFLDGANIQSATIVDPVDLRAFSAVLEAALGGVRRGHRADAGQGSTPKTTEAS